MLSGFREHVARPRVARVRSVLFEHCPVCALCFFLLGPLGDASGNFPFLMTFVDANSAVVSSCLSVWVGCGGERMHRHAPVEGGVLRPPRSPVYGMCREFRVSGASVFKVM